MLHLIPLTLSLASYWLVTNGDAVAITTVTDAMEYLVRFGYLDPPGFENPSYLNIFSTETFSSAIEDFQSFTGFKKTGQLDEETLKYMNKPRCGVPDRVRPNSSARKKRFAIEGSRWPKKQLTYKIKKYTKKMGKIDVDREIARAFQMWADVTDLTFIHLNELDKVDIEIHFASGEHGNCPSFNDGQGGVYAHATYPQYGGGVHFDESEIWTLNSDKGTNLFQVATHEFGHSLGLNHTDVTTAVMHNVYKYSSNFKLDKDDIEGIQHLYGENLLKKLTTEYKAMKEEWAVAKTKLETEIKSAKQEIAKTKVELTKSANNLATKLNANLQRLGHEVQVAEDNLRKELRTNSHDLETATTNLAATRMELGNTKSAVADLTKKLNERTSEMVEIGRMPNSCADLQRMGQKISGFFFIAGMEKMEIVYCDFFPNKNDKQKWIGYTDIRSADV